MTNEVTINFCPLCGDRVSNSDNICSKCNYDLNDYRTSVKHIMTTESTQDSAEESFIKRIAPVAIGVTILLAAGIGITHLTSNSNKTPAPASDVTVTEEIPLPTQDKETTAPEQILEEQTAPLLGEHWIKDENTDVYLWNPEPQDGESISWSGSFVEDDGHKFANGNGVLTWYRDGQVIQVDEGAFEHGRHHGQFKHTFKSGNVDYSNWNHGEEIPLPPSANSAEDEARQAFIEYHQAITNKDYNSAYATLTTEQKQRVGDFNSYSAGYTDTLSSEVSNLSTVNSSADSATFDYRLTARDKMSGSRVKVQIFDGQVTLVKIDGHWYISNAKSRKVDEWLEK